jgi:DNA-binding response OmpR family regulator
MPKILIVDDDVKLGSALRDNLEAEGFKVELCISGADMEQLLKHSVFDLIILDWELPDGSGPELCSRYRNLGGMTPVLMLTGRGDYNHKAEGLESGADDYVAKPFHPRELLARIRALLRRPAAMKSNIIQHRDLMVDTVRRSVTRNDEEIKLQPIEFDVLLFFLRHPDRTFSPEDLLAGCWTSDASVSSESVYSTIRRIRKKLDVESEESILTTVHGNGYRLDS